MESEARNPLSAPDSDVTRSSFGAAPFRAGALLCERFRVIRFIARGGMGELYEAEDIELGERVALKTIRSEISTDERVHQRFRREVQLARKVTHPNICRIFDLFHHIPAASTGIDLPPSVFVTMELLQGETLGQRLGREGRLNPEQALPIIKELAAALSAAHAVGVVHRDFKSSNVMLLEGEPQGGAQRVVVTDFGLAHSLKDSGVAKGDITGAGEMLGTPDYMAPEQIEGGAVTPATDIYALGVVIYEMVTGEKPFAADTPFQSAMRRITGPPPRPPRDVVPGLPVAWERAIMRCLSRQPEHRFPDASAVADSLIRQPRLAANPRRAASSQSCLLRRSSWRLPARSCGAVGARRLDRRPQARRRPRRPPAAQCVRPSQCWGSGISLAVQMLSGSR